MDDGRDAEDRFQGADRTGAASEEPPRQPFLSRVPSEFVPLGAGFLLTASIVASLATAVVTYLLVTGDYSGPFQPAEEFAPQMLLVELQFLVATGALIGGTYFARRRVRWGTVMLACSFGSLVFITLPFTVPAFVLVGLGKYHFSLHTPADRLVAPDETPEGGES